MDLLTDTGEDDNVRVDCHTDGEQDTCDSGQCQCYVKRVQDDRDDQDIDAKCECCAKAGQPVDRDHQESDQRKTEDTGCLTGSDRILSKLCTYDLGTESLQFNFQSTDTDVGSKALCLFDRVLTGDDSAAVCDRRLYSGNTDKSAVIIDTDRLACCIRLSRSVRKLLLSLIREGQGNDDLLVVHIVILVAGFSFLHIGTFQDCVAVRDDLLEILGKYIVDIAVSILAKLIVLVSALICLSDEIQRAGLTQFVEDLVGLFNA